MNSASSPSQGILTKGDCMNASAIVYYEQYLKFFYKVIVILFSIVMSFLHTIITHSFNDLIIYMKKLLDSDWLRTVQFFLNTVQKRGN